MPIDLLVRNATLVTSAGRRMADMAIRDGRFVAIESPGAIVDAADQSIDATGLVALPGVIDAHVHFREPGLEHEETWLTGTRAAVFGGVTTVLDMPNTVPPTDTVARARQKLALASQSAYCDFGIFGLLGESVDSAIELAESGLVVGLKVFMGPTTGSLSAPDDDGLRRALLITRELAMRVAFHAEDRAPIEGAVAELRSAGRIDALAHVESRPVAAEVQAIDRIGRLLVETGAAGHVLHTSSAEGLAAIGRWRSLGVHLTSEVTPQHLLLNLDAYTRFRGLAKANPPIRGEPHSSSLMAALTDGRIDSIASDHAPHPSADKLSASIWEVPAGIPGVETMLALMLTEVTSGRITLERLAHVTSERPARVWGIWPRKGAIQVGSDADLTLVDLDRGGLIRAAHLHGLNNATPFEGRATSGAPVATIVGGRIVMRDGELLAQSGWGTSVSRS